MPRKSPLSLPLLDIMWVAEARQSRSQNVIVDRGWDVVLQNVKLS